MTERELQTIRARLASSEILQRRISALEGLLTIVTHGHLSVKAIVVPLPPPAGADSMDRMLTHVECQAGELRLRAMCNRAAIGDELIEQFQRHMLECARQFIDNALTNTREQYGEL